VHKKDHWTDLDVHSVPFLALISNQGKVTQQFGAACTPEGFSPRPLGVGDASSHGAVSRDCTATRSLARLTTTAFEARNVEIQRSAAMRQSRG
jgi:hypothetical protein